MAFCIIVDKHDIIKLDCSCCIPYTITSTVTFVCTVILKNYMFCACDASLDVSTSPISRSVV